MRSGRSSRRDDRWRRRCACPIAGSHRDGRRCGSPSRSRRAACCRARSRSTSMTPRSRSRDHRGCFAVDADRSAVRRRAPAAGMAVLHLVRRVRAAARELRSAAARDSRRPRRAIRRACDRGAARPARRAGARRAESPSKMRPVADTACTTLRDSRGRVDHLAAPHGDADSKCSSCAVIAARASWRRRTCSPAARPNRRGCAHRRGARAVRRSRRAAREASAERSDSETLELLEPGAPAQAHPRRRARAGGARARPGLAWSTDVLVPWSHWITPSIEPKRFSARFFVASCRPGRTPQFDDDRDRRSGVGHAARTRLARAGELQLPPPQVRTCWELVAVHVDQRRARRRPRAQRRAASDHAAPRAGDAAGAAAAVGSRVPRRGHRREHAADVPAAVGERTESVRPEGQRVEARRRTWFDERGLSSSPRRRPLPFYAGAMHYWRVHPRGGRRACARLHSLGLTIVETYVPWRVHEPEPGTSMWSGERDLAAVSRGRARRRPRRRVRPGPHINAELTSFGIPDWVLADADCQARTAHGTPAWLPVAAARVSDSVVREHSIPRARARRGTRRSPRSSRRTSRPRSRRRDRRRQRGAAVLPRRRVRSRLSPRRARVVARGERPRGAAARVDPRRRSASARTSGTCRAARRASSDRRGGGPRRPCRPTCRSPLARRRRPPRAPCPSRGSSARSARPSAPRAGGRSEAAPGPARARGRAATPRRRPSRPRPHGRRPPRRNAGSCASASPVAGTTESKVSPEEASTHSPPT